MYLYDYLSNFSLFELECVYVYLQMFESESESRCGKTGIPTQNILPICDFDMRFTYVGQVGSMHDTSVLYNAMKVDHKFFPHPPKGNLNIISDSCFISIP
jgi:hypothetical protein